MTRLGQPRFLLGALIAVACLVLYSITLAPDILAHDCSDWEAAGVSWGISHSPGSPAYIIIANLFALVPIGPAAAPLHFLSAVVGTAGVVAVYVLMLVLLNRTLPAVIAAISLAVAGTWWSQSSIAAPYNMVPALMAVLLTLLLLWSRSGDRRLVWAGAALTGFGLSYHPSLLYFLPVVVTGIFVIGPWRELFTAKTLLIAAALLVSGLSFYAYLPLRSAGDPVIEYAEIDTVSSFIDFVTVKEARQAGFGLARIPGPDQIGRLLRAAVQESYFPSYSFLVFGPALVLFYPGVWPALGRFRRNLLFLGAAMTAHMLVIFALSVDYAQYYMPVLLYFSLWAGFSVFLIMAMAEAYLPQGATRWIPVVATGAIYLVVLGLGMPRVWNFANHSEDRGMRTYVDFVLERAQPGAVVLANWESYTGLTYAQKIEGTRPDLKIYSVPADDWREGLPRYRQENPGRPILLSRTLPFDDRQGVTEISQIFFLSIKGRTFQDQDHGEPFPAAVVLYQVN